MFGAMLKKFFHHKVFQLPHLLTFWEGKHEGVCVESRGWKERPSNQLGAAIHNAVHVWPREPTHSRSLWWGLDDKPPLGTGQLF